jgi:hypothetical protein
MFSEEEFEGLKPPSCKQNVEKNSNKNELHTFIHTLVKLVIVFLNANLSQIIDSSLCLLWLQVAKVMTIVSLSMQLSVLN